MDRKVNDAHVHIGRSSMINQMLSAEQVPYFREKYGVDNMMLMTLDVDINSNNQKIIELAKKYKFVHGLFWIQQSRLEQDLSILRKEWNSGVIGVKFHGSYEKRTVTDPVYTPIIDFLSDKKGILLVHAGRFKDGSPISKTSYFHPLKLAKSYPNIKVIIAHMGGNDTSIVREAMENAKNVPNVYFDCSGISTPYRIEYAVKVIGPRRVLFGSDYPWCSFRSMYYGVDDAMIDEKTKDLIFYENFMNILNT